MLTSGLNTHVAHTTPPTCLHMNTNIHVHQINVKDKEWGKCHANRTRQNWTGLHSVWVKLIFRQKLSLQTKRKHLLLINNEETSMYVPNINNKIMKQTLSEFKGEALSLTVIIRDFNVLPFLIFYFETRFYSVTQTGLDAILLTLSSKMWLPKPGLDIPFSIMDNTIKQKITKKKKKLRWDKPTPSKRHLCPQTMPYTLFREFIH